ncbi:MAG: type II CAAX endopeptidase family protein [Candidatus Kapaibacterium sp.]|nr:CPBP family intramembrane metalloprotease [Ignavibacteriota bacterium]MCB9220537.1 CPBP family intramembrane metalloprotease [Ignavibacteria bacterium]
MIITLGILFASTLWFLMFAEFIEVGNIIHNNYFWIAMTFSASSLALYSIFTQKDTFKSLLKINKKLIIVGIVHAILLYGLSRLGVFIAQNMFAFVVPQIEAIYTTKTQLDPLFIGLLLIFIIGPSEEIFWRGFVQNKLSQLNSPKKALIITTIIYCLVHIWALNPMLLVAALVLGVHWGLLFYKYKSLVPGIISHALWDTMIFVLFPIVF